jgi:hypothetical protein
VWKEVSSDLHPREHPQVCRSDCVWQGTPFKGGMDACRPHAPALAHNGTLQPSPVRSGSVTRANSPGYCPSPTRSPSGLDAHYSFHSQASSATASAAYDAASACAHSAHNSTATHAASMPVSCIDSAMSGTMLQMLHLQSSPASMCAVLPQVTPPSSGGNASQAGAALAPLAAGHMRAPSPGRPPMSPRSRAPGPRLQPAASLGRDACCSSRPSSHDAGGDSMMAATPSQTNLAATAAWVSAAMREQRTADAAEAVRSAISNGVSREANLAEMQHTLVGLLGCVPDATRNALEQYLVRPASQQQQQKQQAHIAEALNLSSVQLAALQLHQQLRTPAGSAGSSGCGWQQPHQPVGTVAVGSETNESAARRHWELHGNAFPPATVLGRGGTAGQPFAGLCSAADAPQAQASFGTAFATYSAAELPLDSPMHAQRSLKVSEGVSSSQQISRSFCNATCPEAAHLYVTSGSAYGLGVDSRQDSFSSMQGGSRPGSATKRALAAPEGCPSFGDLVGRDLNSLGGFYGGWRQPGCTAAVSSPSGAHRPSKRQLFP